MYANSTLSNWFLVEMSLLPSCFSNTALFSWLLVLGKQQCPEQCQKVLGPRAGKQKSALPSLQSKELALLCLGQLSDVPVNLESADASCVHFQRFFQALQLHEHSL